MSMNIELDKKDYHSIMTWYDLAFGCAGSPRAEEIQIARQMNVDNTTEQDETTWNKLMTMQLSFLEKEVERLKS